MTWAAVNKAITDEVNEYYFCADGGDYMPTEKERLLLEDFANGLVENEDFVTALEAAWAVRRASREGTP